MGIILILGVVAGIWAYLGIIPGIVLLVMGLTEKDAVKKKKRLIWAGVCLFGIVLMMVMRIVYPSAMLMSGDSLNDPRYNYSNELPEPWEAAE